MKYHRCSQGSQTKEDLNFSSSNLPAEGNCTELIQVDSTTGVLPLQTIFLFSTNSREVISQLLDDIASCYFKSKIKNLELLSPDSHRANKYDLIIEDQAREATPLFFCKCAGKLYKTQRALRWLRQFITTKLSLIKFVGTWLIKSFSNSNQKFKTSKTQKLQNLFIIYLASWCRKEEKARKRSKFIVCNCYKV